MVRRSCRIATQTEQPTFRKAPEAACQGVDRLLRSALVVRSSKLRKAHRFGDHQPPQLNDVRLRDRGDVVLRDWSWMGGEGAPVVIADACLFLASSAAAFMTGQYLVIDDGMRWQPVARGTLTAG